MNKDDNWWDAVGKNDWRERQIEAETLEQKDKLISDQTLEIELLEAMIAMRDAQIKVMMKTPAVFFSNRKNKVQPAVTYNTGSAAQVPSQRAIIPGAAPLWGEGLPTLLGNQNATIR
jgi:hypothetical protein